MNGPLTLLSLADLFRFISFPPLSPNRFVANATPAEYTENLKEISDVNTVQVSNSCLFLFLHTLSAPYLVTTPCTPAQKHKTSKPTSAHRNREEETDQKKRETEHRSRSNRIGTL